jgi:hypothetical protein
MIIIHNRLNLNSIRFHKMRILTTWMSQRQTFWSNRINIWVHHNRTLSQVINSFLIISQIITIKLLILIWMAIKHHRTKKANVWNTIKTVNQSHSNKVFINHNLKIKTTKILIGINALKIDLDWSKDIRVLLTLIVDLRCKVIQSFSHLLYLPQSSKLQTLRQRLIKHSLIWVTVQRKLRLTALTILTIS